MLEHAAMLRGTVERLRFRGASLEDNALGDPAERELIVYLPPGYHGSARRYPLVMVLAGYAATHESLLNFKPWEPNLFERYEALLAGGCGEAILVLPDCFTRLGGSQYIDSPASGRYQSYLADDVLSLVESRYRTLGHRAGRAIVGKSSGGFGALRMGMDRPEQFAVIGSHAGDCAFELCIRPRFIEVLPVYERHGGARAFLSALAGRPPRSQAEFHALELLALAHCYAPVQEAAGAPFGELPVDLHTALIVPEKWARWLAHDPVVRAETMGASRGHSLADARLVFLDAGKADEYGLQFGARLLAERLVRSGVAVEHEEFEGGHMGTAHRYDVSLPKLIAALDPPETQPSAVRGASSPALAASFPDPHGPSPVEPSSPRATGARVTRESP